MDYCSFLLAVVSVAPCCCLAILIHACTYKYTVSIDADAQISVLEQAYSLRLAFLMLLLFFISILLSFSFFSSSLTRSFCSGLVGFMMRELAVETIV